MPVFVRPRCRTKRHFAEIENGAEYANLNVYYPNFTLGYTTVFPTCLPSDL